MHWHWFSRRKGTAWRGWRSWWVNPRWSGRIPWLHAPWIIDLHQGWTFSIPENGMKWVYGGFLKYGYSQIIHLSFNYRGFFHYKPSIWDTPIKMETLIWMGSSLFYIYLPHCLISPRLGIDRQQRRGSSEADLIISDGSVFGNPRNFGHFFSGNTFPEFV